MSNPPPPYALFIRGSDKEIFALSDKLGFEMDMQALAVSVFEDGPGMMHVQALFNTRQAAKTCLSTLDVSGLEHFITQLPDENWTAKSQAGLPPLRAGRFFIYGAHDAKNIPPDAPFPVQIGAGMAFGTGHHATTLGCLLAFEELLKTCTPKRILDLGCGSGLLAIAAAKALGRTVLATDIDQDAVIVTRQNAQINGVKNLLQVRRVDGIEAVQNLDLIFANILAQPLIVLAPDIAQGLAKGGMLILAGLLDEQTDAVLAAYQAQNLSIIRQVSLEGWTILTLIKA